MASNLIEVAKWVEHDERLKIRLAKIKEILKAWDDLFFILIGEEVYRKYPGSVDYASFEKNMRMAFEKTWQKHSTEGKFAEMDDTGPPGVLLDGLKGLLSVNFTPPQDGKEIAMDLLLLKEYYRSKFFFPSIEMALDLSLCKLLGAINRLYGAARARGKTILTGIKKHEKNVASSQTEVFAAFYHLKIKDKPRYTSKSHIAKDIKAFLILKNKGYSLEEQKNVPSEKTIIRYMESDDQILNELIKMGVIKDKTTVVQ